MSYSAILGSKTACVYPRLIAACHGLHRHLSLVIPLTADAYRALLSMVQLAIIMGGYVDNGPSGMKIFSVFTLGLLVPADLAILC